MSLRRRLFLLVFVPVAILYYGFGIFGVYQTRSQLIDDLDTDLLSSTSSAATVLEQLTTDEISHLIAQPGVESPRLTAVVDVASGEILVQRSLQDGETLPPPADDDLLPSELARNLNTAFTIASTDGTVDYRAVATRLDGGRLLIAAQPLDRINSLTQRFLIGTLLTGLMILAAMAAAVYVGIRSGLRPLRRFIDTTVRVAEGDLTERVDTQQDDPAFAKIAHATNHMLDQVELSYEKERVGRQRLNELVADAAHELRTPLTAIRGTIEMRAMGAIDTDDKLRTAFRGINEHSERMVDIVEDLIVIARAENMRLDVQSQTTSIVDLEAVVRSQVSKVADTHPNRAIDFKPTTRAHEVAADEALLRTAIDQLLENAITHTPEHAPISVQLTSDDEHTHLTIADAGHGVPEDIRDRIFDRFVRGDQSRARTTGGAGLGLSIVQSIIESANGTVALTSNSTAGSTFEVTLPLYHRSTGGQATSEIEAP